MWQVPTPSFLFVCVCLCLSVFVCGRSSVANKPAILDSKGPFSTMKYRFAAIALTAVLAQSMAGAQARPTDIYVSVVDSKGEPAAGLTADDFRVREDGTAREVLKAGAATGPLTVALLIDDSQAA